MNYNRLLTWIFSLKPRDNGINFMRQYATIVLWEFMIVLYASLCKLCKRSFMLGYFMRFITFYINIVQYFGSDANDLLSGPRTYNHYWKSIIWDFTNQYALSYITVLASLTIIVASAYNSLASLPYACTR